MTRSREWLLYNAVEAWLYHYQSDSPMSEQYKQLRDEFHDAYMQSLNKDAPPEPEPKPITKRRTTRGKVQDAK